MRGFLTSVKHGFFKHSHEDDTADVKLNAEQLCKMHGADDQPSNAHAQVDATHHPVEGQERPVYDAEIASVICKIPNLSDALL